MQKMCSSMPTLALSGLLADLPEMTLRQTESWPWTGEAPAPGAARRLLGVQLLAKPVGKNLRPRILAEGLRRQQIISRSVGYEPVRGDQLAAADLVLHHQARDDGNALAGKRRLDAEVEVIQLQFRCVSRRQAAYPGPHGPCLRP